MWELAGLWGSFWRYAVPGLAQQSLYPENVSLIFVSGQTGQRFAGRANGPNSAGLLA